MAVLFNRIILFLFCITVAFAVDLRNPGFESPLTLNTSTTSTKAPFLLLNESNSIPGWTIEGTVEYVASSPEAPLLPQVNGHAIKLGQDGEINQTFVSRKGYGEYLLTFVLAPATTSCSNSTGVIVSVPDRSSLISFDQRFGKEAWSTHGVYLGSFFEESVNVILRNSLYQNETNSSCGPIIDSMLLKAIGTPIWYSENILSNGGFEYGPAFPSNSTEGILLESAPTHTQSVLQQWSIKGTVKYIKSSMNYKVPKGNAAIEIVSGEFSGVEISLRLKLGATYSLDFMIGDANDSCIGEFLVGAQAGSTAQNFTFLSNGTGLAQNYSMSFKVDSPLTTSISLLSYKTTQNEDLVLCGPVIDNVILLASNGLRFGLQTWVVFSCLLFLALQISG